MHAISVLGISMIIITNGMVEWSSDPPLALLAVSEIGTTGHEV